MRLNLVPLGRVAAEIFSRARRCGFLAFSMPRSRFHVLPALALFGVGILPQ